ncbi:glycosyltransferase [Paracoccus luteus]|uniref:glycosyltransferase n=1 Tax=Paracoccus luteus TaxID=2508543 RepID=UPI00106FE505|nr:glycosyltransferase [Paracoccus luteus]
MTAPGARPGAPAVSVIVVSRHRPAALSLCLTALSLQSHPDYEIVLVADPGSIGQRPDLPARRVAFDVPNISQARNRGLAAARGAVVAFVDDDAVAEPGWLAALTAPFADPRVIAAAGFTRGPDGLGWQLRAERMTRDGLGVPLAVTGDAPVLLAPDAAGPVGTIGTNCAFRAAALAEIGGFDPAFPYHLDESDVNLRMAARWPQALTAVVPRAEVAHGLAADAGRGPQAVPRDLTQLGRSQGLFAARHGGTADPAEKAQRARLIRHMVAGRLDPLSVGPLMASWRRGLADAARRGAPPLPPPLSAPLPAPLDLRLDGQGRATLHMAGWHWRAAALRRQARDAAAAGRIVTLLLLTPTVLPHRSGLTPGGWWEQRGGLWGPSGRDDPPLVRGRFAWRAAREFGRLRRLGR